jgi:hypothetical protein
MQKMRIIAVLGLALAPPLSFSQFSLLQKSKAVSEPLWSWFGDCRMKKYLGIEVLSREGAIYKSSFPICPDGDHSSAKSKRKILVFHFKGGQVFQGRYRTATAESIEGNIWQASSDDGSVLLGLSFASGKQILLNTVHVARPDRESTSEIDRGLKVRTFPLRSN